MRTHTAFFLLMTALVGRLQAAELEVPSPTYPDIASAIGAAGDGDVITISPGTYTEHLEISNKTNLVIQGSENARIFYDPAGPVDAVCVLSSTGITFRQLRVDADSGSMPAFSVTIEASSSVTVSDCRLITGVRVVGSTDVSILDCVMPFGGVCAIDGGGSSPVPTSRLRVEHNEIGGGGEGDAPGEDPAFFGNGVDLSGCKDSVIAGNQMRNLGSSGICLGGESTGNVIVGNHITKMGNDGIDLPTGSTGNMVAHNSIHGCGTDGICVEGDGNVLARNAITKCESDGMAINGDANLITDNEIGSVSTGLAIRGKNNKVLRTAIKNAGDQGISLGGPYYQMIDATGNMLYGNTISGGGLFGGIVVDDHADGAEVCSNIVSHSLGDGIDCYVNDCRITANEVRGAGQGKVASDGPFAGIFVIGTGNQVLANTIRKTKGTGLWVGLNSNDNTIVGNSIKASKSAPLTDQGTNNTLFANTSKD